MEVDVEHTPVYAASSDVVRLLNNVLDNAVQASTPDGTIRLTVVGERTRSVITVSDSGPGFVDRMNRDGIGIGIAVVAAITVRLDGELVLGRSPLGGAMVTISLPRADANDPRGDG